jgi:hypothetical protein
MIFIPDCELSIFPIDELNNYNVDYLTFPNCVENTIMNFIRLLKFTPQSNNFKKIDENNKYSSIINSILKDELTKNEIFEFSRYVNIEFNENEQMTYGREINHNNKIIRFELEPTLYNFSYIVGTLLNGKELTTDFNYWINVYSEQYIITPKHISDDFSQLEIISRRTFKPLYLIDLYNHTHAKIIVLK